MEDSVHTVSLLLIPESPNSFVAGIRRLIREIYTRRPEMSNGEKPWKQTVIKPELRKMPWMLTLMIIILAIFPEIVGYTMFVALQNNPDEYWIGVILVIFTSLLVGLTIALFMIYRRKVLQRASWLMNTQQARTMIMTKGNRILGGTMRGEIFPRLRTVDSAEAYISFSATVPI